MLTPNLASSGRATLNYRQGQFLETTGDRITARCLLLAVLGPREMSDLSLQSGPERTLVRALSLMAILGVEALPAAARGAPHWSQRAVAPGALTFEFEGVVGNRVDVERPMAGRCKQLRDDRTKPTERPRLRNLCSLAV